MPKKAEDYNEHMRVYMRDRYRKRRAVILEQLGGKCVHCSSRTDLEIDHRNPKHKEINVSRRLAGLAVSKLTKELKKCQLLCRPCHELKSIKERGHTVAKGTHGTLSAYRWCGPPKCDECKKAKRLYVATRRKQMRDRGVSG